MIKTKKKHNYRQINLFLTSLQNFYVNEVLKTKISFFVQSFLFFLPLFSRVLEGVIMSTQKNHISANLNLIKMYLLASDLFRKRR